MTEQTVLPEALLAKATRSSKKTAALETPRFVVYQEDYSIQAVTG
jgi:hypothetical protein